MKDSSKRRCHTGCIILISGEKQKAPDANWQKQPVMWKNTSRSRYLLHVMMNGLFGNTMTWDTITPGDLEAPLHGQGTNPARRQFSKSPRKDRRRFPVHYFTTLLQTVYGCTGNRPVQECTQWME